MADSQPCLKRARIEDESVPDLAPAETGGQATHSASEASESLSWPQPQQFTERDEHYWLDDGNIILSARNVGFKVYKGLLAEHSAVFRSMFDVAQGAHSDGEQVDGCPIVPLDDSPEDLRQLFRLIYPLMTSITLGKGNFNINIDMLSAIIRLDHKYELVSLQPQAMGHLTTYYTTRFDQLDDGTHASQWKPEPLDAIDAIAMARLTNTPSILPLAFYDLCSVKVALVLKGRPLPDGSFRKLPEDDLELYFRARDKFTYYNARIPFLLFRNAKDCVFGDYPGSQCAELLKNILFQSGFSALPHKVASSRVFNSWQQNVANYVLSQANADPRRGGQQSLCPKCKSHVEARDRELRQQVWRKLPGALSVEIPGWETAEA